MPGGDASIEICFQNQDGARDPKNYRHGPAPRLSRQEFRTAVIAGDGHYENIARATGYTRSNVAYRIAHDPELKPLFGHKARTVSLGVQVTRSDLETYRAALKVYGVSEAHLAKLRALDGLAVGSDRLLAVSFQVSHQSYVGQLHNLDEVADAIKERLKGSLMQDGTYKPLEDESLATLSKVYVDCVKERGRGMKLIVDGIEAIERMKAAASGKETPKEGKAVPGWGPMKKVRPAENLTNGSG